MLVIVNVNGTCTDPPPSAVKVVVNVYVWLYGWGGVGLNELPPQPTLKHAVNATPSNSTIHRPPLRCDFGNRNTSMERLRTTGRRPKGQPPRWVAAEVEVPKLLTTNCTFTGVLPSRFTLVGDGVHETPLGAFLHPIATGPLSPATGVMVSE